MKKRLLPLMLALVLCLGLTIPALAAEEANEDDAVFVEAIPFDYSIGMGAPPSFHEGVACTWESVNGITKCGFIDKTGETVIPCMYDWIDSFYNFSEGLAAIRLDGKWGYIDKAGETVIPFQYDAATDFSEGLAGVMLDDKCGFIDKTGQEVIPCMYSSTSIFCEGLAGIQVNGKWGFIDKTGEEIIPCQYDGGHNFSEGLAKVETGGKCGFIDQTGQEVIPCKYSDAGSFSEGLAAVEQNGKWGFIDKTGEVVISCQYEGAADFSEGLALVVLNDKGRFFIDRTGEVVISCQKYSGASSFSEGFAPVEMVVNDCVAAGYIDKTGKEVVPCVTDSVYAPDRYIRSYAITEGMAPVVHLIPADGDGALPRYGYLAVVGGKDETPEPMEVTAKVSNWAKELVDSAAANGLIADGLGENYTGSITRAQFAAVSVKLYEAMSGETAPAAGDSPFTDTSDTAVIQAEALGFVGGVGGGKFDPASLVTREQAATMLSRVYTKLGGEIPTVNATTFADNDEVSSYATSAVAFMADKEIVGGVGDNKFAPKGNASIEQALVIALRMFENLK